VTAAGGTKATGTVGASSVEVITPRMTPSELIWLALLGVLRLIVARDF
jgi:hypothetical protein